MNFVEARSLLLKNRAFRGEDKIELCRYILNYKLLNVNVADRISESDHVSQSIASSLLSGHALPLSCALKFCRIFHV